jgi:hypothetical protein
MIGRRVRFGLGLGSVQLDVVEICFRKKEERYEWMELGFGCYLLVVGVCVDQ